MAEIDQRHELRETVTNALRSIHMGLTNAGAGYGLLALSEIAVDDTPDGVTVHFFIRESAKKKAMETDES